MTAKPSDAPSLTFVRQSTGVPAYHVAPASLARAFSASSVLQGAPFGP